VKSIPYSRRNMMKGSGFDEMFEEEVANYLAFTGAEKPK
jgi:hypothetical protein